jgi:hypothetical protein
MKNLATLLQITQRRGGGLDVIAVIFLQIVSTVADFISPEKRFLYEKVEAVWRRRKRCRGAGLFYKTNKYFLIKKNDTACTLVCVLAYTT